MGVGQEFASYCIYLLSISLFMAVEFAFLEGFFFGVKGRNWSQGAFHHFLVEDVIEDETVTFDCK